MAKRVREELDARAKLVTRDEFARAVERIDRRFEALVGEVKALREDAQEFRDHVKKRLDEIAMGAGASFEAFCVEAIKEITRAEGRGVPHLEVRRHFRDPGRTVHEDTTGVEVDLFCDDPPVVAEVTYRARDAGRLRTFLRKVAFLEREAFGGRPARRFFCALEVAPEAIGEVRALAEANGVRLITKTDWK